jgi:shikimate dehydrogenase
MPATAIYYDLVYNPLETTFLARARAAGAATIDGLGMLIHQGAAAFERWTGQPAPIAVMRAAALAGLAQKQ